jgi:hypothetical protein
MLWINGELMMDKYEFWAMCYKCGKDVNEYYPVVKSERQWMDGKGRLRFERTVIHLCKKCAGEKQDQDQDSRSTSTGVKF